MSVVNRKSKISALVMAGLITANFACATDAYKNNVVDVRVNGGTGNAVKVTIYTDKPYTEPVVVNKKANNKYVILLPETNSSLKGAPTVSNGTGTISNVSVNTQAVTGGKGYTKIVITSEKAINVVPRTQQLTSKPAAKPTTTAQKPETKPVVKPAATTQKTVAQKPDAPKTVKKQTSTASKPVTTPKVQPKPQVTQPVKVAEAPPQETKQPIEVLEQEVKTGQSAPVETNIQDQNLQNNNEQNLTQDEDKKSVIENIKSVIRDYQNLNLWKLILLAGAVTFPIIVIMIILTLDKRINKKIDMSFRKEEEEEQTSQYGNTQGQVPPVTGEQNTYSSFDEMLDKAEETTQTYYEQQLNPAEHADIQEMIQHASTMEYNGEFANVGNEPEQVYTPEEENIVFNNDYVDTDFVNDIPETPVVEPEMTAPPVTPASEPDTSSQAVVENKAVTEPPAEISNEPAGEYNPDGFISDFAQVDDKDFFDELAMQTLAEANKDGLPEESPADEIFNFMREDDVAEDTTNLSDYAYEQTAEDVTANVNEDNNISNTFETPQNNISNVQPEQKYTVEQTEGDDELTMLTEVKLNDSTGLYLVNYENFSSLVGHINDNYFVLKKFDDIVSGRIILKQAEKLKDSTRYLVRVGKNKMVVEISEYSMSRLIDL